MYENKFIITKFYEESEFDVLDNICNSGIWEEEVIAIDDNNILCKEKKLNSNLNLDDLFLQKLNDNFTFYSYTIPYSNTKIKLSKMEVGDFKNIHNESIMYGDYATTIFLNEPSEYEGGELSLFIENRDINFKLNKGFSITYKTGTLTKINPITEGNRLTVSFYTKSMFKDDDIRNIYSKLLFLNTKFESKVMINSFEESFEDPNFLINEIKDYLIYTHSIVQN